MTETAQPLITFVLFAYNQEEWIEDAVNSALAQDYDNLELAISDDCSTDGTFSKIQKLVNSYVGPHKIRVVRNERNLGIGLHVQKVLSMARGELIVMAAGDDVSLPHRVSAIYENWVKFGKPDAVASSLSVIDKTGECIPHSRNDRFDYPENYIVNRRDAIIEHFSPQIGIQFLGATLCYSRRTIDFFGGFYPEIGNEDVIYVGRALLLNNVLLLEEKLVLHRVTGSNVTAGLEEVSGQEDGVGSTFDYFLSQIGERDKRSGHFLSRIKLFEQQIKDIQRAANENLIEKDLRDTMIANISESLGESKLNYFMCHSSFRQFVVVLFTQRSKWKMLKMYAAAKADLMRFVINKFDIRFGAR